jgi:hypothetical protein
MERALLHNRANDGPRVGYPMEHPATAALNAMAKSGRMQEKMVLDEGGWCLYGYITDLGRLALRVCPVDEF